MRISLTEHAKHEWIAHDLMKDFEVEDVWKLPVELTEDHDLALIQEPLFSW